MLYPKSKDVPKFLNGRLLLSGCGHVPRVVERKGENVPVCAEPGDKKGTGKGLKCELDHLRCAHPGRGDAQNHQQATQHLQDCVGAGLICRSITTGFTDRSLGVWLWTFFSCNRQFCIFLSPILYNENTQKRRNEHNCTVWELPFRSSGSHIFINTFFSTQVEYHKCNLGNFFV